MLGRPVPSALGLALLVLLGGRPGSADPGSGDASVPALALADRRPDGGGLKTPYPDPAAIAVEGRRAYLRAGCQGCHGIDAGRNPSLTNDRWVYDGEDDTLFRLIALGSEELTKRGYRRSGRENTYRPMPAQGEALTAEDLWAIIAWLRTAQEPGQAARSETR